MELNKTDLPRTWKIIKDIVGKTKTQNNIKQKIYINGELTSGKDIISNAFNNYFVTIGPQLANKININENPLTYINSTMNSIFIPYINEKDITKVVNSLKIVVLVGTSSLPLLQSSPYNLILRGVAGIETFFLTFVLHIIFYIPCCSTC